MHRAIYPLFLFILCAMAVAGARPALAQTAPEPDPPAMSRPVDAEPYVPRSLQARVPSTEWTLHKTEDGSHPSNQEQHMVWLMNRARANPPAEGEYLATEDDPDVAFARSFWGVDLTVLQNEFNAIAPRPPAAFDRRLYEAAKAHSDYMISINQQTHTGQAARIDAAGFDWQSYGLSVYSTAESGLYAHCGFNIDWGPGTFGMQAGRGHRVNLMATSLDLFNVGIAVVPAATTLNVGPYAVSADYCKANTNTADHYNVFIVGTVYADTNRDNAYTPGEGLGGVTVMPDSGTYYAVTGNAGGYAIPAAPGTYALQFSGGELLEERNATVTVVDASVLQDVVVPVPRIPVLDTTGALVLCVLMGLAFIAMKRRGFSAV